MAVVGRRLDAAESSMANRENKVKEGEEDADNVHNTHTRESNAIRKIVLQIMTLQNDFPEGRLKYTYFLLLCVYSPLTIVMGPLWMCARISAIVYMIAYECLHVCVCVCVLEWVAGWLGAWLTHPKFISSNFAIRFV